MDTLHDPWTEIRRLQKQVQGLAQQVEQLRSRRPPDIIHPRQIRWAVTCEAYEEAYPEISANAFPIRFVDAHFIAEQGQQTFESSERNAEPAGIAFSPAGWVPKGTPVPVFELRGLGESDAGIYWMLEVPRWYPVQLVTSLTRWGSAQATPLILTDDGPKTLACEIPVWDFQLDEDIELEAGTIGSADWHAGGSEGGRFAFRTSACQAEPYTLDPFEEES